MKDRRILLINMPWSRVNGPCLALSLLKPLAEGEGFATDVRYFNVLWADYLYRYHARCRGITEVRREDLNEEEKLLLHQGGDNFYTGEWIFSQAYYGNGSLAAERYIAEILPERYTPAEIEYWLGIRDLAPRYVDDCLRRICLEDYWMVGFTSQFRQQFSSLLLARRIKELRPEIKIIFGGSNCSGAMGPALLRSFPFVDYVTDGEAEASFPALLRGLRDGGVADGIQGIVFRRGEHVVHNGPPGILKDLDRLPWPDFSDFSAQQGVSLVAPLFDRTLVLELSRGCWWGAKHQCKFCGNHSHFLQYRSKSPSRAEDEIRKFSGQAGFSRIVFSDTVLGQDLLDGLMPRLAGNALNLDMFFEVKASIKKEQIRVLHEAGVTSVQPGIESFSTRLLRLMSKGVTALQNVQCLKWCAQYEITAYWNLLYGFPQERPEDYATVLWFLNRITHLHPPIAAGPIRLDRFSPYFDESEKYGFKDVEPMFVYPYIFDLPARELGDLAYAFAFKYADGRDPSTYTGDVLAFVDRWSKAPKGELIHFQAADGTGLIADSRFNRVADRMELDPIQNLTYQLCDRACHFSRLAARLDDAGISIGEQSLRAILEQFVDSRMMVKEGETFLSVALGAKMGPKPAGVQDDGDWLAVLT